MNSHTLQGNWTEIKGKIKTQWAKLNDDDLETVKGNLDQLAGKIQQIYGYGKEQAESEFNAFKKTLSSTLVAVSNSAVEKADAIIASPKKEE